MSKKILVTGAAGFIGSHLTERLVRDGHQVRAFVRYNGRDDRGNLADLPGDIEAAIDVERGDLKDPGAVKRAVDGREWVFHLGALISIPYSYQNPYDVVQTNVLGTAHVLDACRASSTLERVVLTSTLILGSVVKAALIGSNASALVSRILTDEMLLPRRYVEATTPVSPQISELWESPESNTPTIVHNCPLSFRPEPTSRFLNCPLALLPVISSRRPG